MRTLPQISEAELEVMKVIWELSEATSAQIVERLIQATEWKPKTVHTLITRLVTKKAIIAEKTGSKAFIYSSLVSEKEYKAYANKSFLQKMYNGSINLMLTSFIKEQKLSKSEIDNLKKILDEEV
jgi:BlaI family penicillinase repressor